MENKKYFENLDGLRGYAALAVLIFHLNVYYIGADEGKYNILGLGWLGVQVFFVLSGFLITSILINSKNTKNYFSHFFIRRILRIWPIYFLVFFFLITYGIYHSMPLSDAYAYVVFIQNWFIGVKDGTSAFPGIFGHSWTLAVEAQFYLIWPFIIRYCTMKHIAYICIAGILTGMIGRELVFQNFGLSLATYGTISYLDTLLGGALIATLYSIGVDKYKIFIGTTLYFIAASLLGWYLMQQNGISWISFLQTNPSENFWVDAMVVLSPFCLWIFSLLLTFQGIISRIFFGNSLMSYIGKISFGIYLYHVPVLNLLEDSNLLKNIHLGILPFIAPFYDTTDSLFEESFIVAYRIFTLLKIFLTLIIAHFSYVLIEKKILAWKDADFHRLFRLNFFKKKLESGRKI